jgi:hypothetical protein
MQLSPSEILLIGFCERHATLTSPMSPLAVRTSKSPSVPPIFRSQSMSAAAALVPVLTGVSLKKRTNLLSDSSDLSSSQRILIRSVKSGLTSAVTKVVAGTSRCCLARLFIDEVARVVVSIDLARKACCRPGRGKRRAEQDNNRSKRANQSPLEVSLLGLVLHHVSHNSGELLRVDVIVAVRIILLTEHFCLILAKNDRRDPKKAGWIIFFGRLIRSLHVPPPLWRLQCPHRSSSCCRQQRLIASSLSREKKNCKQKPSSKTTVLMKRMEGRSYL